MALSWIERAPDAPYFVTDTGIAWTPVGQNDAISWDEWRGLREGDLPSIQRHLSWLADHGVTCLRFMLEYAETGQHFFEQPAGVFNPVMVGLWDDLFRLVEQAGLRMLLTPLDTYFQWVRWDLHPFNIANGGPCPARTQLMVHPKVRALIKARLAFATERWGGGGTLFAWDLWNEMHPVQGEDRPNCFDDYINDLGPWLRDLELRLHGRAHLQTASVFGPELHWKPWLNEPIFRNKALDFANNHFYEEGTIDDPADTVAPTVAFGTLMTEALAEITDGRPFFDSEHGPIHTFKDHHRTLPEAFDDEYFRHCQWAHLASGGAGGGMRWPNRSPHRLTPGMRRAQRSLAMFLQLIDWPRFQRRILNDTLRPSNPNVTCFGCGDAHQAVLWMLRTRPLLSNGQIDPATAGPVEVIVPGLAPGPYQAILWETAAGQRGDTLAFFAGEPLRLTALGPDLAIAIASKHKM